MFAAAAATGVLRGVVTVATVVVAGGAVLKTLLELAAPGYSARICDAPRGGIEVKRLPSRDSMRWWGWLTEAVGGGGRLAAAVGRGTRVTGVWAGSGAGSEGWRRSKVPAKLRGSAPGCVGTSTVAHSVV